LAQIPKEDKFYSNSLDVKDLQMPQLKRGELLSTAWQPILTELTRQNVAKNEVVAWYSRQPNGLMSMSLIHERGEFNATDDAYHLATTTKRGTSELKDFGSKLIAKTYVVVLSYAAVRYSASSSADQHSWSCTVRAFVYKLRYNDVVENQIYDTWIDEDDSPQQMADKQRRFNQIALDMDYITQVSASVSVTALITGRSVYGEEGLAKIVRATMSVTSKDELLTDMYHKGYKSVMNELEKKVPEFKVLAGVSSLQPIRAKIGKKEGLRTDQRYFVTEYEMANNGKIKAKRKAVVRVGGNVVDNRRVTTGNSGESNFYQIAGRKVEKGMTLEQKNDMGLSVALGYGPPLQNSSQSGVKLRVEQMVNKLLPLGIPALYLYAEGEVEVTDYHDYTMNLVDPMPGTIIKKQSRTFSRVGLGLGKGYHFGRNFSLSPHVGMGYEYADVNDIPLETVYTKLGVNLTLNIYYPLQLVGGASGFCYFAPQVRSSYTGSDPPSFSSYNDVFQGRNSFGFSGFLGVRICF
jgi:hypothetical protein